MGIKIKTTINMMVRDEPFAALGLLSIIDYADNALIYDTGSTDGTYEQLQKIEKLFPDKIILKRIELPNGQTWSYKDGDGVSNLSQEASETLGKLRRDMHLECDGEIVWLLDGDEVYYNELSVGLKAIIDKNLLGKVAIFPPFIDLHSNGYDIRLLHDMGRIFLKDETYVNGDFGYETHYAKSTNKNINNWDRYSLVIRPERNHMPCVLHFESPVKPWRKHQSNFGKFQFKFPEVFYKPEYQEFVPYDKFEFLKEI